MKTKKSVLALRLLAIGLLLATIPFFLKRFVPVADWVQGLIMGLGIGLELVAVVLLSKIRNKKTTNI